MRGGSRQQAAGAVGADGLRLIEMRGPLNTGQLGTAPGPGPGAGVITSADCFNYCGLHNPCLPRHWSLVGDMFSVQPRPHPAQMLDPPGLSSNTL